MVRRFPLTPSLLDQTSSFPEQVSFSPLPFPHFDWVKFSFQRGEPYFPAQGKGAEKLA